MQTNMHANSKAYHVNYDKQLIDACYSHDISSIQDALWHDARNTPVCMMLSCYLGYYDVFMILSKYCHNINLAWCLRFALLYDERITALPATANSFYFVNITNEKMREIRNNGFTQDRLRIVTNLLQLLDGKLPKTVRIKQMQRIMDSGYPLRMLKFHDNAHNRKIVNTVTNVYKDKLTYVINSATMSVIDWDSTNLANIIVSYVL